ncbi:YncE family protein [Paracoccus sanguinis]|uniref:YncE family protein n=1 Tax=Paracoccus sanguinis TaxID=1545044 RepID=UPI00068F4511|nr:YncE family protein [Paracoccus sanguinis]
MRRVAAALLLAAAPAGAGDLAVVTSQTAQAVSLVDLDSGAVRVTVPVAGAPAPVAYDPATGRAYVISAETGALTVLDADGAVLRQQALGEGSFGIALDPAAGRMFVTDWYGARLRCLTLDGAPVWAAATGPAPAGVALSGDGRVVVTADRDADRVSAFDAATGAPLWQAPTGTHPYAVTFHAGRFWTADVQSDSVTVIDAATGRVTGRVETGSHPYGVAFAAGKGFVTDQYAATVTVFDADTLAPLGRIEVGDYPEGIAALSDGRRLALANWDADTLTVIDGETLTVAATIDVPAGPRSFGLFVGPAPQSAGTAGTSARPSAAQASVPPGNQPTRP